MEALIQTDGEYDEPAGKQHDIMFDAIVTVVFLDGDSYRAPLSRLVFGESKVLPVKRTDQPFRIYTSGHKGLPSLKTETTSWSNKFQNGEITPDTDEMFTNLEGVLKKAEIGVTKSRFVKRCYPRDDIQQPVVSDMQQPKSIEEEWKRKYW
jgi:hypothetical protein